MKEIRLNVSGEIEEFIKETGLTDKDFILKSVSVFAHIYKETIKGTTFWEAIDDKGKHQQINFLDFK
jgi:hypothetical protein